MSSPLSEGRERRTTVAGFLAGCIVLLLASALCMVGLVVLVAWAVRVIW